jgi:hypothetical protein
MVDEAEVKQAQAILAGAAPSSSSHRSHLDLHVEVDSDDLEEDEANEGGDTGDEEDEYHGEPGSIYNYSAAAAALFMVDVTMELAHDQDIELTLAFVLGDLEWHDGEIVEWSDGTGETDAPEHAPGFALVEFDGEVEKWVQLNWLRFVEHRSEDMMLSYPPGHEEGRWWTDEAALKAHMPTDLPVSPWAEERLEEEAELVTPARLAKSNEKWDQTPKLKGLKQTQSKWDHTPKGIGKTQSPHFRHLPSLGGDRFKSAKLSEEQE